MLFCFLSCLLCFGIGVMFAWPSSTLRFFESGDKNISRPFSDTEMFLFGILPFFGALIGVPVTGIFLDKIGRKYCGIILSSLCTLSWVMIAISTSAEVILTAIFISGLSAAMFAVAPIYISEICRNIIRGAMTSGCIVLYEIGMLVSYILGNYLDFQAMVYTCLCMSTLGTLCISTLKDSPVFLMSKGMEYEAAKSIAFFRGIKPDSREVVEEMNEIRRTLNTEMDTPDENSKEDTSQLIVKPYGNLIQTFKYIRRSRSTERALLITMFLASATAFQGIVVVDVYTEELFDDMFPSLSSIFYDGLMLITSIVSGFIMGFTIELAGRRCLMVYTSIVTGISCTVLATQIYLKWTSNWFTFVFLIVFTVSYTIGAGTVPFAIIHEVFLPEVKCVIILMIIEWLILCLLIVNCIMIPLIQPDYIHGLGSMLLISAVYCFLTALFCTFYLPETMGVPVYAIQELFIKKPSNSRNRIFTKNKIKSLWGLREES